MGVFKLNFMQMTVEFITRADLETFKNEISEMIKAMSIGMTPKKWLRSKEVREMLGISPGTLQNMRINGDIPFTKLGGTLFYDADEIGQILEKNKSLN